MRRWKHIRAKKNILNYQSADDIAVLNRDDENSWHLRNDLKGKIISFGFDKPAENNGDPVIYCENMAIKREMNGEIENLIRLDQIRLRGRHNIANTMAAFAVSTAAGFGIEAMRSAVKDFTGVEHRCNTYGIFTEPIGITIPSLPHRNELWLQ